MPTTGRAGVKGSLPVEVSSFVGRRWERAEVKRSLAAGRLVTLTGVGGTGKTRLALRVAAELRRLFADGVWFVDLTSLRAPELLSAEVRDPDVLAYSVLVTLGVRERPDGGSTVDQLVRHLADRQVLVVLDGCEPLLPACAVLAHALLRGCPRLRILATSREPLLAEGEVIFSVSPLPTPDPQQCSGVAEVSSAEAVALFVARAQEAAPDFTVTEHNAGVVAELCRRLDGVPLALELAAARIRVLAPVQILQRLAGRFALLSGGNRGGPQRQQTLRACVDWSFELCSKPERVLWLRLSLFAGGCELDAVEAVCADELLPAEDMVDLLAGLVDKSILISEDVGGVVRYRMLETIRDYGQETLADSRQRDELRRRHRDWYVRLAHRFEAEVIGPRQPDWFARLDRELPNIRAVLQYSLADPDGAEAALTVVGSLFLYWSVRALTREARCWADQALARPGEATLARAKVAYTSAGQASMHGDLTTASMRARQTHELAVRLADPRAQAIASAAAGLMERARGNLAEAVRCFRCACEGLAGEETGEYLVWRVAAIVGLAMTEGLLGDAEAAAGRHELILKICQPRGESFFVAYSSFGLGIALWKSGDVEAAAVRLREGLQRGRLVNDCYGSVGGLDALAWIACDRGGLRQAATLLGAVAGLAHEMGTRPAIWPQLAADHEQYEQRTRAALGERAYQTAYAYGGRMSLDEAIAYALEESRGRPAPSPDEASTTLTRREWQVATLLAQGLSNKAIAHTLVISPRTAESHVANIMTRLGFTSRAQVTAWIADRHQDDEHP